MKQEALAAAEQVATAYPDDALAAALLGSANYNTGRSAEAVRHLQRCLAMNPAQVDAYEILARVAYEKGDPEESARLCQLALKHGPPNPEILNRLGHALMDLGRTEEAIRALQQAISLPQAEGQSHYLLGQAYLQSGNPASAREGFLKAVALVPDHTQAFFGLYTACQRLGHSDEAARYRTKFQELEASDRRALGERNAQEETLSGLPLVRQTVARTLFGAAQIHRLHQQPEKAVDLYYRAAVLDTDSTVYRAALEASFLQTRDFATGIRIFEKLTAEQPTSHLDFLYLGRLHARLQRVDAAEQSFRKVQELAPAWSEGYRALAELYLRSNRKPDDALALARKAVELAPTAPHYHLLAAVCANNNDLPRAVDAIQRAVALEPGQAKYREFLQKLKEMAAP